jgi:hypothetical protein
VKTWPARVPSSLPALPSPPPLFLSTGGGELGFFPWRRRTQGEGGAARAFIPAF